MEQLELKHIVSYLPYGLQAKSSYGLVCTVVAIDMADAVILKDNVAVLTTTCDKIMPILRHMDDLGIEIADSRIKPTPFVPIVELLSKFSKFKYQLGKHAVIASDRCIDVLVYSKDLEKYELAYSLDLTPDVIDCLNSWHFDYRGLIDRKLAIDYNSL